MRRSVLTPLFLATAALAATAQHQESPEAAPEKAPEKAPEEPAPRTLTEEMFAGDDLRQEMFRLFREVEQNLVAIDDELASAGAGDIALGEVADSGLSKLLRSSKEKSDQVVSDIDRILEIVQQMGST